MPGDERLKALIDLSPFDQSRETQKQKYDHEMNDPIWVKRVVDWFKQNVELSRDLGLDAREVGGGIIGNGIDFPGNWSERVISVHLGEELASEVVPLIKNRPNLVLLTPKVRSEKTTKAIHRILPTIDLSRFGGGDEVRIGADSKKIDSKKERLIAELANHMGIVSRSTEEMSQVAELMWRSKEELLTALYQYHVLNEAATILSKMLPDHVEEIERVKANTLLVQSFLSDVEGQTDFSYMRIGPFYVITVQKSTYAGDFDEGYGYRVMSDMHELAHAWVGGEILGSVPYLPGINGRNERDELYPNEVERFEKEKPANMENILQEAVAIWAEMEMTEEVLHQSGRGPTLVRLEDFYKKRRGKILEIEKLKDQNVRIQAGFDTDPSSVGSFAYSEGLMLVDKWKSKGIPFSGIGKILREFLGKTKKEFGINGPDLGTIPLDYSLESTYQRMIKMLTT